MALSIVSLIGLAIILIWPSLTLVIVFCAILATMGVVLAAGPEATTAYPVLFALAATPLALIRRWIAHIIAKARLKQAS